MTEAKSTTPGRSRGRPRGSRSISSKATQSSETLVPGSNWKGFNPEQEKAQKILGGPQRHTLLRGGSRSGKTFLFVRAILARAIKFPGSRHAIIRHRLNAVRASVAADTLPKVVQLCFPGLEIKWEDALGRFKLGNGSEIWLLGLDEKERVEKILGLEFATIFFNECSQIPWPSADVALTRLAQVIEGCTQRAYYDLNPTTTMHWTYRLFIEGKHPDGRRKLARPDNYKAWKINPEDNRENLTREYLDELAEGSESRRKRFYAGEYVPGLDGALWTPEMIERCRGEAFDPTSIEGKLAIRALGINRIVIGVDPSGTSGKEEERSGDVGIVVCGRQNKPKGKGFVLQDATMNAHPGIWGRAVCDLSDKWGADCIVVEKNFGGEMARHTIKSAAREGQVIRVKDVTATRGKHIRAEPIAAIYEEERVEHCGVFDELEEELCLMSADGYKGPRSPNRLDAEVWAMTELFGKSPINPGAKVVTGPRPFFGRAENQF